MCALHCVSSFTPNHVQYTSITRPEHFSSALEGSLDTKLGVTHLLCCNLSGNVRKQVPNLTRLGVVKESSLTTPNQIVQHMHVKL
jgi:hypothetical protein